MTSGGIQSVVDCQFPEDAKEGKGQPEKEMGKMEQWDKIDGKVGRGLVVEMGAMSWEGGRRGIRQIHVLDGSRALS